jgi:hypothetical protein
LKMGIVTKKKDEKKDEKLALAGSAVEIHAH